MKTADRILELLYDRREGYFALDELGAAARADRREVDRALDEIQQRGQGLDRSPASGVRLSRPVRLAARLVERGLRTRRIGRSVICFDEVDSTNDVALEAIRQGGTDGLVVLAESQLRGRGRHGRTWISPPGRNVLLSALLLEGPGEAPLRHDALTIATGLAAAEAIEQTAALACELKWPNDVLLDGAKVAGVLVETRSCGETLGLVLGVGINANAAPPPGSVPGRATCLADHLGRPVERIEVVRSLLGRLDAWVARLQAGGLEDLHRGFLARCRMINERVTIVCDGRRHTGRVLDVDPLRGLILCRDDGGTPRLPAEGSTVVE